MAVQLMAAMRDASWFNSPGVAHVYHVVAADGSSSVCGLVSLYLDDAVPADGIEEHLRCKRCRWHQLPAAPKRRRKR